MNLKEYQKMCQKTAVTFKNKEKEIMTWGLGIVGEAGDVAGCIKKTHSHQDNQIEGVKENLGDTMWYVAMICNFYSFELEDVLNENVEKLKKRFPEGFSYKKAKRSGQRVDWNEK